MRLSPAELLVAVGLSRQAKVLFHAASANELVISDVGILAESW